MAGFTLDQLLAGHVVLPPCPSCGGNTLGLDWRLVAKPIGTYSLAGVMDKVAATRTPYIVCRADGCDFAKAFKRDGGEG